MQKLKLLFHSNWSKMPTGFGRHSRILLSHLYRTGKYDIVEFAAGAGLRFDDPRCAEVPWKCYGTLPNDPSVIQQVAAANPGLDVTRAFNYGMFTIDEVVKREKPDIYIGMEDPWAFNGEAGIWFWDKPWWTKITSVIWTPLDSLPIWRPIRENGAKIKNLWVKAPFAVQALKDCGVNARWMPALVGSTGFYRFSDEEREKNREKYKIAPGELVFGFVFKNQLRKLVTEALEAFKLFLDSGGKGKLLLHTEFEVSGSWEIHNLIKDYGVAEHVLCTYICRKCRDVTIETYQGREVDCPKCNTGIARVNPNNIVGVSAGEMNEIYNLMDAVVHPVTSGGFEMPVLEAMLIGIPVGTSPYSATQMFTDSGFCFPFECSYYYENGSGFRKSRPEPASIARFMTEVAAGEWEEKGQRGREWAEKTFDSDVWCRNVEEFLDSCPRTEYKFEFGNGINLSFPMPEHLDGDEFIGETYHGIVGNGIRTAEMETARQMLEKEGKKFIYEKTLEIGRRRQQVGIDYKTFFKDSGKKRLMYMMPKSVGDCVMSLSILAELEKQYPKEEWDHYVCTEERYFEIFEHLDVGLVPFNGNNDVYFWEGRGEHKGYVDVCLQPHILTQVCTSYTHNGKDNNRKK